MYMNSCQINHGQSPLVASNTAAKARADAATCRTRLPPASSASCSRAASPPAARSPQQTTVPSPDLTWIL